MILKENLEKPHWEVLNTIVFGDRSGTQIGAYAPSGVKYLIEAIGAASSANECSSGEKPCNETQVIGLVADFGAKLPDVSEISFH